MNCLHCNAPTSNGLALCEMAQAKASADLEFLPVYFRNLARWRPGRAGSRPVPGSRVLYEGERMPGTGDRISDALDEVHNALTTWARALSNDRPTPPRPLTMADAVLFGELSDDVAEALSDDQALAVSWLCIGFTHHLTSIATIDWCAAFVAELGQHEARLQELTPLVPGWYAGGCKRCGVATYVVPGMTWVTCGGCGTTTHAGDHLEVILEEARGWVDRPKALAEAVVVLVDTELSVPRLYDRIRQWSARGRLEAARRTRRGYAWSIEEERIVVAPEEVGHARYRLGDVLDLLRAEGGTRLNDTGEAVVA